MKNWSFWRSARVLKNWCISASPFSWFLVILGSPWGYLLGAWGALWLPLGLFFDHFYVKLCFLGAEWAPRPSQRWFFMNFGWFWGESGEDLGWISHRFLNSSHWFFHVTWWFSMTLPVSCFPGFGNKSDPKTAFFANFNEKIDFATNLPKPK